MPRPEKTQKGRNGQRKVAFGGPGVEGSHPRLEQRHNDLFGLLQGFDVWSMSQQELEELKAHLRASRGFGFAQLGLTDFQQNRVELQQVTRSTSGAMQCAVLQEDVHGPFCRRSR